MAGLPPFFKVAVREHLRARTGHYPQLRLGSGRGSWQDRAN